MLGALDLTESEQVAGAICRFPEVAQEVARLEADMLRAAEEEAVKPPAGLADKIWAAIEARGGHTQTIDLAPPAIVPVKNRKWHHKVIPFAGSQVRKRYIMWAQAAALIVLLGSVAFNVMLLSDRSNQRHELALLQHKMDEMSGNQQQLSASLNRYKHEADMMAQPGMMPVPMRSMLPGHPMAATMYWDKTKHEAYVSVQKLPPPPTGMQYQLWAIADGKPVDIGMLDNEIVANGGMQKVPKAVMAGQAFAVSLEKAGGNPAPTPDKIYLMGKLPV